MGAGFSPDVCARQNKHRHTGLPRPPRDTLKEDTHTHSSLVPIELPNFFQRATMDSLLSYLAPPSHEPEVRVAAVAMVEGMVESATRAARRG